MCGFAKSQLAYDEAIDTLTQGTYIFEREQCVRVVVCTGCPHVLCLLIHSLSLFPKSVQNSKNRILPSLIEMTPAGLDKLEALLSFSDRFHLLRAGERQVRPEVVAHAADGEMSEVVLLRGEKTGFDGVGTHGVSG